MNANTKGSQGNQEPILSFNDKKLFFIPDILSFYRRRRRGVGGMRRVFVTSVDNGYTSCGISLLLLTWAPS